MLTLEFKHMVLHLVDDKNTYIYIRCYGICDGYNNKWHSLENFNYKRDFGHLEHEFFKSHHMHIIRCCISLQIIVHFCCFNESGHLSQSYYKHKKKMLLRFLHYTFIIFHFEICFVWWKEMKRWYGLLHKQQISEYSD